MSQNCGLLRLSLIIFKMFSTGTQRKYWNFQSLDELGTLREEANDRFVKKHIEVCSFL